MWTRIRAVIIEDEPLAAQYLAHLLGDTCQVEVVGLATEAEAGLRLCAELRPDAVFADINLPGKDGVHYGDRLYRVRLRDRASTEITASRTGAAKLGTVLKTQRCLLDQGKR